jgi:hypothetical protein
MLHVVGCKSSLVAKVLSLAENRVPLPHVNAFCVFYDHVGGSKCLGLLSFYGTRFRS